MRAKSLFAFLLNLMIPWAYAEPGCQSHASIVEAIDKLIESEFRQRDWDYQAETLPLDPRLRLAECQRPLEAFFPQGRREAGTWSVGVRCVGDRPWTIYGKVRIKAYREVVVLRNALRSGSVVGLADVGMVRKNLSELNGGYLTAPEQAVGLAVRHGLPAGLVLGADRLTRPKLIRRGEKVTISAQSGGYEVSMVGEALADGEKGERIRVRNEQSARIVEGMAVGPGLVLVGQ